MIEIADLCFKFDNNLILDDVSFTLKPSHIYGLIGPNGSGKTTLLKCLSQDYEMTSGIITYQDVDISVSNEYRARTILLGSEYYTSLMSIEKLLNTLSKKYNAKIDYYIFNTLLDKMLLDKTDIIKNLSKGNKKVAILCAILAIKPKIIYLDEFLDGIDIVKRKYIKDFLLEYIYNQNAIILVASHTLDDIKDLCDNIILLNNKTVQLSEDLDMFKAKYSTYQIISDKKLDKEFFIEKGIATKEIRSFNNIYWLCVKNDLNVTDLLINENFTDIRKIESSIEEVIYYEFIS